MRCVWIGWWIIDILVTGAIGQVVINVVWNGLILFNLQIYGCAQVDTVRLGDLVGVVVVAEGFDWEVLAELKKQLVLDELNSVIFSQVILRLTFDSKKENKIQLSLRFG